MGFLAKLSSLILIPFFELIFKKLSKAITEYIRTKKIRHEIETVNKQARQNQENAKSEKEREDALKDIADRF